MHVRASMCRGMPVVDDGTQEAVATLGDPVLDPDTGRIQGFMAETLIARETVFLQAIDIIGWGMQVHVRSADRLSSPDDIVRLQRLFQDGRTILWQTIRTKESGSALGRCDDVQFDTHHFTLEWLFPRKFFIYRQPVPVTDIIRVTQDAVLVKDPLRPAKLRRRQPPHESGEAAAVEVAPTA